MIFFKGILWAYPRICLRDACLKCLKSDSGIHMSCETYSPKVWAYAQTHLAPCRRGASLAEPSKSTSKLDHLEEERKIHNRNSQVNIINDLI